MIASKEYLFSRKTFAQPFGCEMLHPRRRFSAGVTIGSVGEVGKEISRGKSFPCEV